MIQKLSLFKSYPRVVHNLIVCYVDKIDCLICAIYCIDCMNFYLSYKFVANVVHQQNGFEALVFE